MSPEALPTYALVSPVRDEAADFERTAESILAQTHRPQQWIVVDDGSTDGTHEIAARYAAEHEWIELINSDEHHARARGAPIVRAFNAGRRRLDVRPDVTVKLDGDLFLPAHYFAWVARVFADDPQAGVVGGVALINDGQQWRTDPGKQIAVNGVAKAYRTDCLDDIGGLPASMGWDGIDEYAARARGWRVHVLTELHLLHYKQRGSKQVWWRARLEEGRGTHFMGYLPSFLLVRAVYRMLVERPRSRAACFCWQAMHRRGSRAARSSRTNGRRRSFSTSSECASVRSPAGGSRCLRRRCREAVLPSPLPGAPIAADVARVVRSPSST